MVRLALLMLLVLGVGAALAARQIGSDEVDATAPRGTPLGAAVDWNLLQSQRWYRTLFLRHYSGLTPENELKMEALAPTPDGLDFGTADAFVDWAVDHHVTVHGHTLVWYRQLPAWLVERRWTRPALREFLKRYITEVVRHFRGRVDSWDVVNEPLAADGSLRSNIWLRVLGKRYIADAFRWARAADPDARLYVNEYDVERHGPKGRSMYRLVRGLVRHGVPVDGIGVQAHLTPQWRPTGPELRRIMRRYADLGLRVDISELDVAIGPGPAELTQQAQIYRTVAASCHRESACRRFTTWGFTDASTWLGSDRRPLPFDATGKPKPAWRAIESVMGG